MSLIYPNKRKMAVRWMFVLAVAFTMLSGEAAFAQTIQPVITSSPMPVQCITLTHPMSRGVHDATTSGEVTALQNFLNTEGYLSVSATGYFGPLTAAAVQKFQAAEGISAIGTVGPLTRAAIARFHCKLPPVQSPVTIYSVTPTAGPVGTTVSITGFGFTNDNTIHFGSGTILHVPISSSIAIACTTDPSCHGGINQTLTFTVPSALNPLCFYSGCKIMSLATTPGSYTLTVENTNGTSNAKTFTVTGATTSADLSLISASPSSAPVGSAITLYGTGFNANDYVLIGSGAVKPSSVSNDGTQLTFTLPSSVGPYCAPNMMCAMYMLLLTPGDYKLSVADEARNVTSNTIAFTISGATTSNQPIVINGVDTPSSLPIGTPGTWTVHITVPAASSGTLHYSVVWGDETPTAATASIMAPTGNVQSSATFTHTYSRSGTYNPTFTVSNDSGQSTNVSTSIVVTPLY